VLQPPPDHLRYGDDGLVLVTGDVETRLVGGPIGWAAGDGAGGVLYTTSGGGEEWTRQGASTLWLAAGSDSAVETDMAGVPALVDGHPALVGRSPRPDEVCLGELSRLVIWDLASATETTFTCVDEMGDTWVRLGSYGGGQLVASRHGDLANYSYVTGLAIFDQAGREVDLPANPYGHCGEPGPGSCDVHGLLSPDGQLLATWYRPDYWLVVPADPVGQQPDGSELYADWVSRLDTLPAEIRVHDPNATELLRVEVDARTRLADFDGHYLVVARRELGDDGLWTDARGVPWTIIDITGARAPLTITGPVALATG
jgi:hypothetical protein